MAQTYRLMAWPPTADMMRAACKAGHFNAGELAYNAFLESMEAALAASPQPAGEPILTDADIERVTGWQPGLMANEWGSGLNEAVRALARAAEQAGRAAGAVSQPPEFVQGAPTARTALCDKGEAFREWQQHPAYPDTPDAMTHFDAGFMACKLSSHARESAAATPTEPSLDPAPPNSLPPWSVCARIIHNATFRKRAAAGLEGSVLDLPPTTPEPTELHRFIHEYDDADPYRSAWFMHRLELLLNEVRSTPPAPPVAPVQPINRVLQWPKADRVERRDDMSPDGKLTLMLQRDGDVVVSIVKGYSDDMERFETADVEFCAGGGGGGRSMKTREALVALMVAMESDNEERPISAPTPCAPPAPPVQPAVQARPRVTPDEAPALMAEAVAAPGKPVSLATAARESAAATSASRAAADEPLLPIPPKAMNAVIGAGAVLSSIKQIDSPEGAAKLEALRDVVESLVREFALANLAARRTRQEGALRDWFNSTPHDMGKAECDSLVSCLSGALLDVEDVPVVDRTRTVPELIEDAIRTAFKVGSHWKEHGHLSPTLRGRLVAVSDAIDALLSASPAKDPSEERAAFQAWLTTQSFDIYAPEEVGFRVWSHLRAAVAAPSSVPGDPPMETPEPIPTGIYFSPLADNFYDEKRGQGNEFYRKWFPRRAEFPRSDPPAISGGRAKAAQQALENAAATPAALPAAGDALAGERLNDWAIRADSELERFRAAAKVPPEPRFQWTCARGCGPCGVKRGEFKYEVTEDAEGNELSSKSTPVLVSSCCGDDLMMWDDKAGEHIDIAATSVQAPAAPAPQPDELQRLAEGEPSATERKLRLILCTQVAGALAYLDDGEMQDNRVPPFIDFLRDTPADIHNKMLERARARIQVQPVMQDIDTAPLDRDIFVFNGYYGWYRTRAQSLGGLVVWPLYGLSGKRGGVWYPVPSRWMELPPTPEGVEALPCTVAACVDAGPMDAIADRASPAPQPETEIPGPAPQADDEQRVQAIDRHLDGWKSATFSWQGDPDPAVEARNQQSAAQRHAAECLRRIRLEFATPAPQAPQSDTLEASTQDDENLVGLALADALDSGHLAPMAFARLAADARKWRAAARLPLQGKDASDE